MKKYRILPLLLIVCLLLTAAFPGRRREHRGQFGRYPQSTANVSSDGVPQSTIPGAGGVVCFRQRRGQVRAR